MMFKISPVPAVLAAAVVVAGCTTDPENRNRNTGIGVGALIGAGLGAAVSDDKSKGVVIGTIAGATVGGLVGDQLDKQAEELRAGLDSDILVETADGRLVVTLPQDITFDTDSAVVRPSLQTELNKVAASLVSYPNSTVQVIGHTDNQGDAAYNQGLSERRASSVAAILQGGGVAPGRLTTFGRGENQPIASNLTPEGMARNRRVEIIVIPTG